MVEQEALVSFVTVEVAVDKKRRQQRSSELQRLSKTLNYRIIMSGTYECAAGESMVLARHIFFQIPRTMMVLADYHNANEATWNTIDCKDRD